METRTQIIPARKIKLGELPPHRPCLGDFYNHSEVGHDAYKIFVSLEVCNVIQASGGSLLLHQQPNM